jgi:leucyl-tRNA synthetase
VAQTYVRTLISNIRSAEDKKKKTKKNPNPITTLLIDDDEVEDKKLLKIFVASEFPEWQERVISLLKQTYVKETNSFVGDMDLLKSSGLAKNKKVMPFVSKMKRSVEEEGLSALGRTLSFNEVETLEQNLEYLRRDLS